MRVDKKSNVGHYWGRVVAWEAFSSSAGLVLSWKYGMGHCSLVHYGAPEISLSTWTISKWAAPLLMASMPSVPSVTSGPFNMSPNVTEHELKTQATIPYPHPASSYVWLWIPVTRHCPPAPHIPSVVRIQPLFSSHITFPSSSLRISWAEQLHISVSLHYGPQWIRA